MSAQAIGDAFAHSPYSGDTLLVQLAIADVVNDTHENRVWVTVRALAEKARVSESTVRRARARLVEDGWLTPLQQLGGRGKPAEFVYHLGGKRGQLDWVSSTETQSPATETQSTDASTPCSYPNNPTAPDDATVLTREWWERHDPRPLQPFPAARAVVAKALKGWSAAQVRRALATVGPTVAGWALDKELRALPAPQDEGADDPDGPYEGLKHLGGWDPNHAGRKAVRQRREEEAAEDAERG